MSVFVTGIIPGFPPVVEIEAILRHRTGRGILRSPFLGGGGYNLRTMSRLIAVHYQEGGATDPGPFAEDRTIVTTGWNMEGISFVREIVGYYGGFVSADEFSSEWNEIAETGAGLPLAPLDRYELALIGPVSPDDAKVLRDIAEYDHIRDAVREISREHFPDGSAPVP